MAKAHRSSLREKIQEELQSCTICLEPFQRPKALPCLHSFCQHCLQDYVRQHTGLSQGYFPCPMCRKEIRIPDGGIEHFQDNFMLSRLSDLLEEEEDDNDVDMWQDPHNAQGNTTTTAATGNTARAMNLQNVTVTEPRTLDVGSDWISGSAFLESGELVLCDYSNNRLLLFRPDLTLKENLKLSGKPFDVTAVSRQTVVVTVGSQLLYVNLSPRMTVQKTVDLGGECEGVTSVKGQIFLIVDAGRGQREVVMLGAESGKIQNKFSLSSLSWPRYITVNSCGDRLWVSGSGSVVVCLTITGTQLFRYKSVNLCLPRGMLTDEHNNVLICGCDSNNIHVVTADGKFSRLLLSHNDGVEDPRTVSYRSQDGTLVVGMLNSPGCRIFTVK